MLSVYKGLTLWTGASKKKKYYFKYLNKWLIVAKPSTCNSSCNSRGAVHSGFPGSREATSIIINHVLNASIVIKNPKPSNSFFTSLRALLIESTSLLVQVYLSFSSSNQQFNWKKNYHWNVLLETKYRIASYKINQSVLASLLFLAVLF